MVTAWISLGSNVGDRILAVATAVEGISSLEDTTITGLSSLYETDPVQVGGGMFINAVARIETGLPAGKLLGSLLRLESVMGRERTPGVTGPRTLDLDLLLYGEERIQSPELTIPHPRMTGRRFVMEPLAELAGDMMIPGTGRTGAQIAGRLEEVAPEQRITRLGTLEEIRSRQPGRRQGLD